MVITTFDTLVILQGHQYNRQFNNLYFINNKALFCALLFYFYALYRFKVFKR